MSAFTELITLDGIQLHKFLRVPDLPAAVMSAGSERRTFGALAVQRLDMGVQDTLTLLAERSGNKLYGYFIHEQIEHFRAVRDAGTAVPFVYYDLSIQVVIPIGGIQVEPVIRIANPPANHRYYGSIQVRGVST